MSINARKNQNEASAMAEEIGIYLSMYDKMSPTLKTISNNTKAFDKNLQGLEKQCKAYENRQNSLVGEWPN